MYFVQSGLKKNCGYININRVLKVFERFQILTSKKFGSKLNIYLKLTGNK